MKIVTNLAIPDDVYLFYADLAKYMPDCTTEDMIVDALTRFISVVAADVIKKVFNDISSDGEETPLQ